MAQAPDSERDAVFRALADASRRQLLDLLSGGPLTTGDLCSHFEMSRFGVMKHLGVLQEAGLVTVERRGRERLNHLNAVPLREVYARWVSRYADAGAAGLLALKEIAEQGESSMDMDKQEKPQANYFEITQELKVAAPPERVWAALTTDIGKWWAFHTEEFDTTLQLDARIGGHFTETWGDETEGFIWGTVTYLRKGEKLRLRGSLGSKGGGHSQYTYELEADGAATRLQLHHSCVGHSDPEDEGRYIEGWQQLLQTHLKAYLEEGKVWEPASS